MSFQALPADSDRQARCSGLTQVAVVLSPLEDFIHKVENLVVLVGRPLLQLGSFSCEPAIGFEMRRSMIAFARDIATNCRVMQAVKDIAMPISKDGLAQVLNEEDSVDVDWHGCIIVLILRASMHE